jgi:hypothetical protein
MLTDYSNVGVFVSPNVAVSTVEPAIPCDSGSWADVNTGSVYTDKIELVVQSQLDLQRVLTLADTDKVVGRAGSSNT